MHYMVVLLDLLQLFKSIFFDLRRLGILLLLFHPIHLLCSTNFSNGIRINCLLVPLRLSHTQVHLLLVWANLLLLVLGFLISGAIDHINGNKSLLSSLSFPNPLPSVTLADGSRVSSHGVGTVKLFHSLTINNVLYVPGSPFNLFSLLF